MNIICVPMSQAESRSINVVVDVVAALNSSILTDSDTILPNPIPFAGDERRFLFHFPIWAGASASHDLPSINHEERP